MKSENEIPQTYATHADLERLWATVDALVVEFRENKQQITKLSMDLARETGKFSVEIERLTEVLDKMQIQIGKLVESNMKRSIMIEWVKSSPKFLSVIFGLTSLIGIFFTSNAHKDFLRYLLSSEKARYSVEMTEG